MDVGHRTGPIVVTPPNRSGVPDVVIAAYDRVIATVAGLERKGATLPYTSVNGNMFSFLAASGTLALRLAVTDRQAFIARFATGLHEAHGRVMAEYVTVPDAVLRDPDALAPWFAASWTYASALRPKPTTRRRSA